MFQFQHLPIRLFLLLLFLTCLTTDLVSQRPKVDPAFLPENAAAVIHLDVREIWGSDIGIFFPRKAAEMWLENGIGIDIKNIKSVRVVVAPPTPENPFPVGGLVTFYQPLQKLSGKWLRADDRIIANRHTFKLDLFENVPTHVVPLSTKAWFVGDGDYLDQMFASIVTKPKTAFRALIESTDRRGQAQAILDIAALQPFIKLWLEKHLDQSEPITKHFFELLPLIDAGWISIDLYSFDVLTLGSWSLRAKDEASADLIEDIIEKTFISNRKLVSEAARVRFDENIPIEKAYIDHLEALATYIPIYFQPVRKGRYFEPKRLVPAELRQLTVAGALTALTLPLLQQQREALYRLKDLNDFRFIALALYNQKFTYKQFPSPGSTNDQGKPLLSWRVQILPFIEQQELYDQFHLDEPWDSPHNRTLISQMPDAFQSSKVKLDEGMTNYRYAVGDGLAFENLDTNTTSEDFTDGSDSTVMVLETDPSDAIIWTKPDEDFGLSANPMKHFDNSRGGANVMMADGTVYFVPKEIGEDDLRAALSKSGREKIEFEFVKP